MSSSIEAQDRLLSAIKTGDAIAVTGALSDGADPNWPSKDGLLPLHYACPKHAIMQMLLDAGADPDGDSVMSPLWICATNGDLTGADLLLKAGGSPHVLREGRINLLQRAAEYGHPSMVERMIEAGISIHACDANGNAAMHYAARNAAGLPCMSLLRDRGASVETRSKTGMTPLLTAAMRGHIRNVEALLAMGADPTVRNAEGANAFDLAMNHAAVASGNEQMAVWLLKHHPALAPTDAALDATFVQAVTRGYTELVKLLAKLGADVGQKPGGRTLLQCAPRHADELKRVLRALKTGATIESAMHTDDEPSATRATSTPTL